MVAITQKIVRTPAEIAEQNAWFDEVDRRWLAKMQVHESAGTKPCFNCNTTIKADATHCRACGMEQDKN